MVSRSSVHRPFLANKSANMPMRDSGDCGTVGACVEARTQYGRYGQERLSSKRISLTRPADTLQMEGQPTQTMHDAVRA